MRSGMPRGTPLQNGVIDGPEGVLGGPPRLAEHVVVVLSRHPLAGPQAHAPDAEDAIGLYCGPARPALAIGHFLRDQAPVRPDEFAPAPRHTPSRWAIACCAIRGKSDRCLEINPAAFTRAPTGNRSAVKPPLSIWLGTPVFQFPERLLPGLVHHLEAEAHMRIAPEHLGERSLENHQLVGVVERGRAHRAVVRTRENSHQQEHNDRKRTIYRNHGRLIILVFRERQSAHESPECLELKSGNALRGCDVYCQRRWRVPPGDACRSSRNGGLCRIPADGRINEPRS